MAQELLTEAPPEPTAQQPAPSEQQPTVPPATAKPTFLQQRLQSLDAYRGLIMITLAFTGFGLARTAILNLKWINSEFLHKELASVANFWNQVLFQFEHAEWVGGGYWDMIQPSFMFMVGVAMAYSYAKRQRTGDSWWKMFGHAVLRSFVLIFLGIFLISNWSSSTNWSFMNVLTQIGLGYTFLFLLWNRPIWLQAGAAVIILVGTWALYMAYPTDGIDLQTGDPSVGVTAKWAQDNLIGIDPHWHKNANVGHAIDLTVLNWLPQNKPFVYNRGGYQTINFLPSLATMLFGLMTGELLRSSRSDQYKLWMIVCFGIVGIAAGWALDEAGICPLVKRIWTPSWALYSTGCCLLILGTLFFVIDMMKFRNWAFPLIVVGVNSIAIYCMAQLLKPWVEKTWKIHFGNNVFLFGGELYQPLVQYTIIGLTFWLMCYWMYRQKMFVRI